MKTYKVTLQPKTGGLSFQVQILITGPAHIARQIAENQNPGYRALSVATV